MDDAFTTGFLLIETDAVCRAMDASPRSAVAGENDALVQVMSSMITREAFARGLDILYEGIRATSARETPAGPSGASRTEEARCLATNPPVSP